MNTSIVIGRAGMQSIRVGFGYGLVLVMSLVPAASRVAVAQAHKAIPAITDPREVQQLNREVMAILRSGNPLSDADRATLQKYYLKHVLAGMTQPTTSTTPSRFPDWRTTIVGHLNLLSASPPKYTYVRGLIFSNAPKLVDNRDYSPAARYNALLLIGELNDAEAQTSVRPIRPAVPMAQARPLLTKVLNGDDTQEMKVGALIGLARHARLIAAAGGEPNAEWLPPFVGVLRQTEPGGDGTADGLAWMHRIAIDALGDIGHPDAAPILQPIVSDNSASMMLRCAAAEALGRLNYRNAPEFNAAAAVKGLGELATQSLGVQLVALQEHLISNPPDPRQEARVGEQPRKQPEDPFVTRVRRELKYQLACAARGLYALQQAAPEVNTKNAATDLRSRVAAIGKELDTDSMTPQVLFNKIAPPSLQLENAVKNL